MFTLNYPKTTEEAVDILINILSDEEKVFLMELKEDDLPVMLLTICRYIKNDFGLYSENYELISYCKAKNPDEA